MATEVSTEVNFVDSPCDAMRILRQHAEDRERKLRHFVSTVRDEEPLFRAIDGFKIEPRFDFTSGTIYLMFTGDGGFLGNVWAELRRQGWKPDSRPTEKGNGSFGTHWRKVPRVPIWMYFTSSVCKRVQVGTRTEQVPIYETQCGELPLLETGSEPSALAELGV